MAAIAPTQTQQRPETSATRVTVRASWASMNQTTSIGTPREPGYGARLAVRKYGKAINKLAD